MMTTPPARPARRRGQLWPLVPLGLASVLVTVLLAGAALCNSAPPLRLRTIADIPLAGGTSRFDYESLDPHTGLLVIAHLGASLVSVLDTRTNRIVATIPHIAGVHGVLAVPTLGRVYALATDDNQVAVIDERTWRVIARIPGGDYPNGLAYDAHDHAVFVSDEAGSTDTEIDTHTNRRLATIPLGGEAGNTQYDPITRRIFVDVQTRNQLVAIDPTRERVVARYALPPSCQHDHSLLMRLSHDMGSSAHCVRIQ